MDKLSFTKQLLNNDAAASDELLEGFLAKAESVILRRLYPLGYPDGTAVPDCYGIMQCELASRYFYRMGGEGEIAHSENGVNRTYGSVNDEDLLREIIPFAKVVG